jgi:alpha-ribazole phosphatase
MKTDIYLIRHGQPQLQEALLGVTDSPLSDDGWQQLEAVSQILPDINRVVSSPLLRCRAFAEVLSHQRQLPLSVESQLQECDFGEWDGITYQQLYKEFPTEIGRFWQEPNEFMPPGGEALAFFCYRVESAITKLEQQFTGESIAIVTHGGVIRTLVAWCLGLDYTSGLQFQRFSVDYASITHLSIYRDKRNTLHPRIESMNKTAL